MKLKEVKESVRYQEIVDKYKRKGVLSNDYIYQEAADLIIHNMLYEFCGTNNAFLFIKKDECLRLYYYLNDLEEIHDFDLNENLVVEIIFKGNLGLPQNEMEYLSKCGFRFHLRRDQYCGIYHELQIPGLIAGVTVSKAVSIKEVAFACDLFNSTFDHYSGDFIAKDAFESLFTGGSVWIAKDLQGNIAGALHQTVERGVAWISHVAVVESYRGQGVGQALLDTFVEQNANPDLVLKPKSRYMLWVQAQNAAAVGMYQKKGFKYLNKSTISMLKLK